MPRQTATTVPVAIVARAAIQAGKDVSTMKI
jgi:hypothetical protein